MAHREPTHIKRTGITPLQTQGSLSAQSEPLDWGASGKPSQELAWYGAYNAAKHKHEIEFARSTLDAFGAVTACVVMMAAQFGRPLALEKSSDLGAFFNFSSMPIWPLSDVYIFPYGEGGKTDWAEVKYPFDM